MSDPEASEQRDEQEQEKWYERTRYQVLLFAVGIAIFGLVLGVILDWYIDPQDSGEKKDLVQALGLITAGVAGAVGIFFTWRGQRLTQQSLEDTRKNTQENLRITREGQITERFTRAIDQLGATDDEGNRLFEIRIGGIYALERIARESDEDYWPIMEILTAYVRQNAPWSPEERKQAEEGAAAEKKAEENSSEEFRPAEAQRPDPDIQAIMTVLRRRTRSFGHGEPERLDLRKTNLSGADLTGADLSGVFLLEANLSGAIFWRADLSRGNFTGVSLSGAFLLETNLPGANFLEANLWRADLRGADLRGANLSGALNLTQEQLEGAYGNRITEIPRHLKPPAHWDVKTAEQAEED